MNPSPATGLVERAIEAWHDSDKSLPEWLGWSEAEYAAWGADPNAIPRSPKHYTALPQPTVDREAIALRKALERIAAYPSSAQITSDWYADRETIINIARNTLALHPIDDISYAGAEVEGGAE